MRVRSAVVMAALMGALAVLAGWVQADPTAERWWAPGNGRAWPAEIGGEHEAGRVSTLLAGKAPMDTQGHPFFTPLGRNGRACVTCHQPADGMSLSLRTIRERWDATQGQDPLFAAIDGADCPSRAPGQKASHRLLLERGLFRIPRPWPPRGPHGQAIDPEFTIEVVRDPTGCNLDPQHGLQAAVPYISVYRRPRPATNARYLTAIGFDFEPKNGLPMILDPANGRPTSGNLMADARVLTLEAQALDAMRWHLEVPGAPPPGAVEGVVEFESRLATAMAASRSGGPLDRDGARGGPAFLAAQQPGELQSTASKPIWGEEFGAWLGLLTATPEQRAFRDSVFRGAQLFSGRTFLISDSAGLNNIPLGNPLRDGCAICHNMHRTGMDVAPGQIDLGTTNMPHADPSPELPLFRLTCKDGAAPHPYLGRVVLTQDPGFALTTGRCRDIGKITMQSMRGLAARAPYFANGSARTLRDIVDFYDRRYRIGYTERDKQDLVNLMSVL